MKNIFKFKSSVIWMFIACMAVISCSDDDNWEDKVVEGLPVSLSFDITTPAPSEVDTRATDEQETKIEKLALFFYKDEVSKPVVYEVPEAELIPTQGGTTTNYFYNISVPESAQITSGKWFLYAVANWDKGFWDSSITIDLLKGMTKAEMDKFCIMKKYKTLDITETAILLSGKYGDTTGEITFKGGVNTLEKPVHLKRSIAKIIFNFIDGNGGKAKFTPITYEIHNYCRTSTLFERDGWNYATPTADLNWAGVEAKDNFSNGTDLPIKDKSIMFYMPENVQKAKKTIKDQLMREKRGADNKFENASDNATYIVVHGKYEGPISSTKPELVTADVHYTILLGDFSKATGNVDNYTTRRNTKYTYNVTVNGVNNIVVEATTKVENQPGAEGNVVKSNTVLWPIVVDSHYETRILKISLDKVKKKGNYGLIVQTPYSNYSSTEITEGDLPKLDLGWVEFCKPIKKDTVTCVKYPGKGDKSLMTLKQILTKFHGIDETKPETYQENFIVEKDTDGKYYVYVQVFVSEYFYEKDPLTNGTADLNKFINAKDRVLTLSSSTDISTDGHSSYTGDPLFAISQKSIKSMYDLNAATNPFGIETYEDDNVAVKLAGQITDTYSGSDKDHGHQNYWGNFKPGTDGKIHWSTYVNYDANKMKDEYNYGIYQGLLRNRDLNGDDIIDPEEMKWFIPSVNQHIAIWNGYHALDDEVHLNKDILYYTSTSGQYRTMWAKEGAFGAYKKDDNSGNELVRCIRALKDISAKTTRSTVFDRNNLTFNVTAFRANALRPSGSQKGEYNYHSQNSIENKLPQAFKMAKEDLTATLGSTPGKPGDDFAPKIEFINYTPVAGQAHDAKITHSLNIKITNAGTHSFYTNTRADLKGAAKIKDVNNFNGTVIGQGDIWGVSDVQTLFVIADNGNYVQITNTREVVGWDSYSYGVKVNGPVIIKKNQGVPGNPGRTTSTFTVDEISTMNLCANYYEEPDGSDKGKWRIPNQRELMVMFMFSQNAGEGSSYKLSQTTASRTYYDERSATEDGSKKNGMFFIQVYVEGDNIVDDAHGGMGRFITSANDKGIIEFKIRPVRDIEPSQTKSSFDSGFEPGFSIIK